MQYAVSKPLPRPVSLYVFLVFQFFLLPLSRQNVKTHKLSKAFGVQMAGSGCGRAVKKINRCLLPRHPLHNVYTI